MEYTKKMVMVPQDTYTSLLSKHQDIVQPLVNKIINADDQLESLLNDPTIPADVKIQKYEQLFHRRQQMKKEQEKPMEIQLNEKTASAAIVPQNIIDTLPHNARTFAKVLLEHISRHRNKINWDEKGQLVVRGQPLQGSHIIDLIHDFSKPSRAQKPGATGFEEFSILLKDTHAPLSAFGNKRRLGVSSGQLAQLPAFGVQIQSGTPDRHFFESEGQMKTPGTASSSSHQGTPPAPRNRRSKNRKTTRNQQGSGKNFCISWWK